MYPVWLFWGTPRMLQELTRYLPCCLASFDNHRLDLLLTRWMNSRKGYRSHNPPNKIENIEIEFLRFRKDPLVLAAPGESRYEHFKMSWGPFVHRNKRLFNVLGVLSTVFPETAFVASDFSLVNYEANAQRRRLSNLLLAGILYSKQWVQIWHAAHSSPWTGSSLLFPVNKFVYWLLSTFGPNELAK